MSYTVLLGFKHAPMRRTISSKIPAWKKRCAWLGSKHGVLVAPCCVQFDFSHVPSPKLVSSLVHNRARYDCIVLFPSCHRAMTVPVLAKSALHCSLRVHADVQKVEET